MELLQADANASPDIIKAKQEAAEQAEEAASAAMKAAEVAVKDEMQAEAVVRVGACLMHDHLGTAT